MAKTLGAVMMAAGAAGYVCVTEVGTAYRNVLPTPDPVAILILQFVCLGMFFAGLYRFSNGESEAGSESD
ncbi:hypothetical protein [Burkholderia sp. Ac-20365]|uniref:hypothetical protein n=1 Tax=Burkholderia sp. Ac-20365 TaxID=2703897 RepID=UPI00197BB655|nr:hypothetical protein [Burkholderia sp. Ac-20365]MBN3761096.1 hypothetical protein [Burkholderia sp. Ac-20365]